MKKEIISLHPRNVFQRLPDVIEGLGGLLDHSRFSIVVVDTGRSLGQDLSLDPLVRLAQTLLRSDTGRPAQYLLDLGVVRVTASHTCDERARSAT